MQRHACTCSHNFLNNGLISKIQSSAESAGLSASDYPHVSLIRTKAREQTGADYWKFTVRCVSPITSGIYI